MATTAEELIVALRSEGATEVQSDLEDVEDTTQDTADATGDAAGELEGFPTVSGRAYGRWPP